MFRRKLAALDYYIIDDFNAQDEVSFRNLVAWLENQKIRYYKIEDRSAIDDIENIDWPNALTKYLNELNCYVDKDDRLAVTDWLLSTAIRYEFSDNVEKYNKIRDKSYVYEQKGTSENVLDSLDFNCEEFKDGILKLAKLLNVPLKPNDPVTVLKALSKLISERFNPEAVQKATSNANTNTKNQIPSLSLQSMSLGFDSNDYILNEAAKVLRLLHINDLRNLQTKINETIVAVQLITANPKTDASLGKVGF